MKILVTGGAGFIGSNFVHYWIKNHKDDEVANVDALTYAGNLANLKDLEGNDNYKFIKLDISKKDEVEKVIVLIKQAYHANE